MTTRREDDRADCRADKDREKRALRPQAAPTTAMSVTSPKPIASFLSATSPSQPMIEIAPAPTQAPISASYGVANPPGHQEQTPATDGQRTTQTRPNTVNPSGIR